MKYLLVFLLSCGMISLHAQTWDLISPEQGDVGFYNFSPVANCADSNILWIQDYTMESWESYDLMLEITGAAHFNDSSLLLICGSGSYSDGIYKVNIANGQHEVQFYCYKPKTIAQISNKWYVGYDGGLVSSEDGEDWDTVLFFHTDTSVIDFFVDGSHQIAVCQCSENGFIYHSSDNGLNWEQYDFTLPVIEAEYDMVNHRLFVAMGDDSYSDGCYVSEDYGNTFDNLIFAQNIAALQLLTDHLIAIVYAEKAGEPRGVYILNTNTSETTNKTGNLPTTNICNLSVHPFIDCINLVACIDSGAYLT